jgi:hypothetical protein
MKIAKLILCLACLCPPWLMAQEVKVTEVLSKDLSNIPGKEGLMITVVYPPRASDPIHRHNAHAFLYVLEGSVVMQVKGGKEVTLTPVRASMKVLMMFTSLAGMQAKPNQQSSSCSW